MGITPRSLLSKSCLGVSEGVCVGRDLAVRWAVVCGVGWLTVWRWPCGAVCVGFGLGLGVAVGCWGVFCGGGGQLMAQWRPLCVIPRLVMGCV